MIRNMQIVATVETPEGLKIVDCAVRDRDVKPEVVVLLLEKAATSEEVVNEDPT
jgi:hypothetical protein